jgi:hypothetical protein
MQLTGMFWFGLVLLILGSGPLLAEIAFSNDADLKPIGPALLASLTLWPSAILIWVGWWTRFDG